ASHRKTWQEAIATLESSDLNTLTDSYGVEDAEFEAEFERLKEEWHHERDPFSSSVADIVTVPSYQQILVLGKKVIPLILRELHREGDHPDHWFWALYALVRKEKDPVPPEDRGRIVKMSQAWLLWGAKNGYCRAQVSGNRVP